MNLTIPPSNAKVKNMWSSTTKTSAHLHDSLLRDKDSFIFNYVSLIHSLMDFCYAIVAAFAFRR
jgi:hypothetical protein